MSYVALYRKWRPQSFEALVGQDGVAVTLKNSIKEGRVVHAYLFTGPRGTGKTSAAKIFSKAVNCLNPQNGDACNVCANCLSINQNENLDILEIDAASNRGIDEIRSLKEKVRFAPVQCDFKVYIIDEVHMLTAEAFNALLKTLEEPPEHVIFILATTEPHKIPLTVMSRCQRYDFGRIGLGDIFTTLKKIKDVQGLAVEESALKLIAQKADGGLRDALSLLDQCLSISQEKVSEKNVSEILGLIESEYIYDFFEKIAQKDIVGVLKLMENLVDQGKDLRQFSGDMVMYLRNLLLYNLTNQSTDLLTRQEKDLLLKQKDLFTKEEIIFFLEQLIETEGSLKYHPHPRTALEIVLLKFCSFSQCKESVVEKRAGGVACQKEKHKQVEVGQKDSFIPDNVAARSQQKKEQNSSDKVEKNAGLVLENILAKWDQVLQGVKDQQIITHAFLMEGNPKSYAEGVLTVEYKENFKIHKEKIEDHAHKEIVEKVISMVYNERIKLVCCLEEKTRKKETSLKKEAVDFFGEEMVEFDE